MIIRPETPADINAVRVLTQAAFAPMPYSHGTEGPIIDALRKDGDLTLSLVGVQNEDIMAHITFSPVTIDNAVQGTRTTCAGQWYGLGPVSVAPARQGQGFGNQLIREGLARIKAMGAKGCALIGNPAYYSRFGFVSGGLVYGDVPAEFVQWLSFDGQAPKGNLQYSPGFDAS